MSNSVENPKTLADSIRSFSEDWGIDAVIKENEYGFTAKIHDDIKDSDDMIVMADDILKRLFGKSTVLQTANNQNGLDDIFSVSSVIDDWFINLVMIIGATHSNILISCCSTDSVSNNVVVSRMSSIL